MSPRRSARPLKPKKPIPLPIPKQRPPKKVKLALTTPIKVPSEGSGADSKEEEVSKGADKGA